MASPPAVAHVAHAFRMVAEDDAMAGLVQAEGQVVFLAVVEVAVGISADFLQGGAAEPACATVKYRGQQAGLLPVAVQDAEGDGADLRILTEGVEHRLHQAGIDVGIVVKNQNEPARRGFEADIAGGGADIFLQRNDGTRGAGQGGGQFDGFMAVIDHDHFGANALHGEGVVPHAVDASFDPVMGEHDGADVHTHILPRSEEGKEGCRGTSDRCIRVHSLQSPPSHRRLLFACCAPASAHGERLAIPMPCRGNRMHIAPCPVFAGIKPIQGFWTGTGKNCPCWKKSPLRYTGLNIHNLFMDNQ